MLFNPQTHSPVKSSPTQSNPMWANQYQKSKFRPNQQRMMWSKATFVMEREQEHTKYNDLSYPNLMT